MSINNTANLLLAKEKLGINNNINLKEITTIIIKQDLNIKKLLCKIV